MIKKFIKCFSEEEKSLLKSKGYPFLYEQNGVFVFENNKKIVKFSEDEKLKNVKFTNTINF